MTVRAVLFDLFGTLVDCFPRRRHDALLDEIAARLRVPAEDLHERWTTTYDLRVRGALGHASAAFDTDGTTRAWIEERYAAFAADVACPSPLVLAALDALRDRGIELGLVSNCNPDVAVALRAGPLATRLSAWALSCEVGSVKPEPAIYRAALDALGLDASEVVFVGDGSDAELAGAAAVGLTPVLRLTDLSDSYDPERDDVVGWTGPTITDVAELTALPLL